MAKKLYVGNLAYSVTNEELRGMFTPYGAVESAQVIVDMETGRSRGFGFVEMASREEAQAAIEALDGQELGGRRVTVNEARQRQERGRSGSGRGPRR